MNNIPTGVYNVRLLNTIGQTIQTSILNHNSATTETIHVDKEIPKGVYVLEITLPDSKTINTNVIFK